MPQISFYSYIKDVDSQRKISIDDFLDKIREGEWQDEVLHVRTIKDKKQRQEQKAKCKSVTLSGIFSKRNASSITEHSGYIGIDIDDHDPNMIKEQLAADKYVYSVFTSISANGACAVFRINGQKHEEAFTSISEYLYNTYQFIADPSGSDVSRARYVSFDPDIFINPNAVKWTQYTKAKKVTKVEKIIFAQNDFEELLKELEERHLNICEGYSEWLRVGFAFADKFGENGRSYFHIVSAQSLKYDEAVTNKQFNNCLKARNTGVTISTFYHYIKQAGLPLYSEQTKTIATVATQSKKGGISKSDTIKNLQQFDDVAPHIAEPIVNQVFDNGIEFQPEDSLIEQIEDWLRRNYSFKRNSITRHIEMSGKQMDDKDYNSIWRSALRIFDKVAIETIYKIINSDFTSDYDPFLDFIHEHKDRKRITALAELFECIQTTDAETLLHFGSKWIMGIISSMMGEHSPLTLVLYGKQNTGKTRFFRMLMPDQLMRYYAEDKLDVNKDSEILMCKKLIIMDDEYGGKSKKESKRLKELTSRDTFSIREPYGRVSMDLKRYAVLCGTTNDKEILNDATGNRRIIPVEVLSVDLIRLSKVDKIDVFMAAYHMLQSGEFKPYLEDHEIADLNSKTTDFEETSMEKEYIQKYYRVPTGDLDNDKQSASEIKMDLERWTGQKLSLRKIGEELKKLGYEQHVVKDEGFSKRAYFISKINRMG